MIKRVSEGRELGTGDQVMKGGKVKGSKRSKVRQVPGEWRQAATSTRGVFSRYRHGQMVPWSGSGRQNT